MLFRSLANLFSALSFFGLSIFSLDCFTHVMNIIYFRHKALRITPTALCFKNKFLTQYVTYLYLVLVLVEVFLVYTSPLRGFFWFNLLLGLSYFINEICLEYLFNKEASEARDIEDQQMATVFGGGDTVLVVLIATILGPVSALMILLSAFYIALVYFVILKIYSAFSKKFKPGIGHESSRTRLASLEEPELTGTSMRIPRDERNAVIGLSGPIPSSSKYIPLGGALAIAFIAAMIIL